MKAQRAVPALLFAIKFGLVLLLLSPLLVSQETFFPFIVGKALYARFIIEITLVLWVALVLIDRSYLPRRSWVLWLFAAWVATSLLAAALGVSFTRSFFSNFERMMGVWDLMHWFALVLIAPTVLRTSGSWKAIFSWNLGVAIVLGIIALFQSLHWDWLPLVPGVVWKVSELQHGGRVAATLGNPSFFGAYMLVAAFIASGLLLQSFVDDEDRKGNEPAQRTPSFADRNRIWLHRAFWTLATVLSIYAIFASGTRGALIAFGFTILIIVPVIAVFFANRGAIKPIFAGAGAILGVFLLSVFILQITGMSPGTNISGTGLIDRIRATRLDDGSLGPRFESLQASWRAFADRPITGWGPENYTSAFQRNVDIEYYVITGENLDQAHAKPVEEFVTKGLVGGVTYLALWVAIACAVVRRKRSRKEEVLAYVLLGGLLAYFLQGLLLFDTPSMILQWSLLVAWAVSEDYQLAESHPRQSKIPDRSPIRNSLRAGVARVGEITAMPAGTALSMTAAVALLVVSLVYTGAAPWRSADVFTNAATEEAWGARIAEARRSFDYAPHFANRARNEFFFLAAKEWSNLSNVDRHQIDLFFHQEIDNVLSSDPEDPILMIPLVLIEQLTASDRYAIEGPSAYDRGDELAARLLSLAPNHPTAVARFGVQKLLRGDHREALRIAEEYLVQINQPRAGEIRKKHLAQLFQPIIDDARAMSIAELDAATTRRSESTSPS